MITKEAAIAIIKSLNIDYTDDTYDIDKRIQNSVFFNEISVCSGASKVCLLFDNADFVVKYVPGYRYQKEPEKNEALREIEIYEKAKEANLDMFFPYTENMGKINDTYFILQEKIDFSAAKVPQFKKIKYRNITKTAKEEMIDKINKGFQVKNSRCRRYLNDLWISMILVLYGKTVCKKLCNFIQENRINDLHDSNIGYKNDKPIILDFSGYFR